MPAPAQRAGGFADTAFSAAAVNGRFANKARIRLGDLGADGDADAVEGALHLYNREPVPSAAAWMDYQIKWMWSKQDSAHRPRLEQFRGGAASSRGGTATTTSIGRR